MHTGTVCYPQTSTQVVRIGHSIEHQNQRLSALLRWQFCVGRLQVFQQFVQRMHLGERVHPRHHTLVAVAASQPCQAHTVGLEQAHTYLLHPLDKLAHAGIAPGRVNVDFNDGFGCGLHTHAHGMKAEQCFGSRHAAIIGVAPGHCALANIAYHPPLHRIAQAATMTTLSPSSTAACAVQSVAAESALPRYLALAGPTAAGKTAAALAMAQRWPVEIISVDSALVYRGMDLGTAKPTAEELSAVPHHLINIRDPLQAYSAAEFVRDARQLMAEITARGRWPLLVGGTMLYFKALRDGLDDMPAASPALRADIEQQAARLGWAALHAELAQIDPVSAARLNPADSQRIARALEVYRASGRPLSSFHTAKKIAHNHESICASGQNGIKDAASLLISLEPLDRAWLHQRIAQRFDAMLTQGLLDEVTALRARGDLHADLPSMRCVGYRQVWQAQDGLWPLTELRERGIAATRQLAKRQITWLRAMPERRVVACDADDALAQVLALVQQFLGPATH